MPERERDTAGDHDDPIPKRSTQPDPGNRTMRGTISRDRITTPGPRIAGSRSLRAWMAILLTVAAVSIVVAVSPSSSRSTPAGAAAACTPDSSNGCQIVLPCTPPATQNCPTVTVDPVNDVVDGEYLFVRTTNFDGTGSIRVAICSLLGSQSDPACLSGTWESNNNFPDQVPIASDSANQNLTSISYPAFYDPNANGDHPMPAQTILGASSPAFYCDNTSNPCAIIITAETGQGVNVINGQRGPEITPQNSAVFPLNFRPLAIGCPSSAPQVQTLSSFSLQQFMPLAVQASCAGTNGVTALNTTLDAQQVVQDYVSGGAPVAFIDDVDDPAIMAPVQGTGYSLIPIAVTGTEVGFLAGEGEGPIEFPLSSYNVTPNMLAGIVTSAYGATAPSVEFVNGKNELEAGDELIPPLNCQILVGCETGKQTYLYAEAAYNAFNLLNPTPAGVSSPSLVGAFNSSVSDASSFNGTSYICDSPNTPFSVTTDQLVGGTPTEVTQSITDPNLATQTLTTAPGYSNVWPPPNVSNPKWPLTSCQGTSSLPLLGGGVAEFVPAQSPGNQAKQLRSWAYNGGTLPPPNGVEQEIGFALMDTSEASFLGINAANLQNAAGAFVAPTVTSLEQAASDMTPCSTATPNCPLGTYAVNYSNPDPTAYAMPNVTYALVPTAPQPAATATEIKNLLTNLVTYSHTGTLPSGYVPLPSAMYKAALSDISTDISSIPTPAASASSSGSSTTGSTGSSGSASSGSNDGSSSNFGVTPETGLPLTATPTSTGGSSSPSGKSTSPTRILVPAATTVPSGVLLVALDTAGRLILPGVVLLALISLLGGLLLLFGPNARRRRREEGP